jgi:hypothetical protein
MTKEELKDWFLDKFNSCYSVKHNDYPDSIFMIYDTNYIRKKKLANILNKEVEYPTEIKGDILFEYNYEYLFCNYNNIWSFFEVNYIDNYLEIKKLIKYWLVDHKKLNMLTISPSESVLSSNWKNPVLLSECFIYSSTEDVDIHKLFKNN